MTTHRQLNLTQLGILIRDAKEVGVIHGDEMTRYLTDQLQLTPEEEQWLRTTARE